MDVLTACAPHVRLVHDFEPGPSFELPPRRINDHALLYVRRGRGILRCAGGRELPLEPRTLMLVPPDAEHGFLLRDPERVHLLNIHYDPVVRDDSSRVHYHQDPTDPRPAAPTGPLPAGATVEVQAMAEPQRYEGAFRRLPRVFPAGDAIRSLTLRAAMIDLIATVLDGRGPRRPIPGADLERARRQLEEAPGRLTVDDAARVARMGRSAFAAAFRLHYGATPMDHRRRSRIERAKADLAWGSQPVKAVARRAGFATVQHFTRVFTELVGETPAAYALRLRGTGG